jgi:stage V sporulation protein S
MNRFLSKLDLRDIKIDPEGSRFPPDADEHASVAAEAASDVQAVSEHDGSVEDVPLELLQGQAQIEVPVWDDPGFGGAASDMAEEPAPIIQSDIVLETSVIPQREVGVEGVIVGSDGEVLKVSARSRPSAVAGAIAGVVREAGRAEVQAIGAGATNQAVKAVAIARDYLRETGIDAICVPAFIDVRIDNEDRTAIRLVVEPR